jgi:hypothetical protein
MIKLILFNLVLLTFTFSFSQKNSANKALRVKEPLSVVEKWDATHCAFECEAYFPGGKTAWERYLSKNFRRNEVRCQMISIDTAYTESAFVEFIVTKDGSIADVVCTNEDSINIALKKEAIRLIKEAPKWSPAQKKGRYQISNESEKISIAVYPQYE